MPVWIMSLLSVVLVSSISLIGALGLLVRRAKILRAAAFLVSFAVGTLLGDAFIHLIPESLRSVNHLDSSLLVLLGILVFFLVEKGVRSRLPSDPSERKHIARMNLAGDAVHNFIDGVLIGASYLVSPTLGVSTTIAVVFHEIPQELGDFGIFLHSGYSIRRALGLNLLSALTAIVGTLSILVLGDLMQLAVTRFFVPIAAGGFVYIAASDLIPILQEDKTLKGTLFQAILILAGIGIMASLKLSES